MKNISRAFDVDELWKLCMLTIKLLSVKHPQSHRYPVCWNVRSFFLVSFVSEKYRLMCSQSVCVKVMH